jgi:hypothetical protein
MGRVVCSRAGVHHPPAACAGQAGKVRCAEQKAGKCFDAKQGAGRAETQQVEKIVPASVGSVLEGSKDSDAVLDDRSSVRESASRQGRAGRVAGHANFSMMRVGSHANLRGGCSV